MFSKNQLEEMLKLQAQANDIMSTAWRTSTNGLLSESINYYRAAFMEAAEAIGHAGIKWWKKEPFDEGQIRLEVVDILHFTLSEELRTNCFRAKFNSSAGFNFAGLAESLREGNEYDPCPTEITRNETVVLFEQYIYSVLEQEYAGYSDFCVLANALRYSPDELYAFYIGKNALNKFRTENGQKENKYIKIWHGREDNEWLTDFLNKNSVKNYEDIYIFLTETYATVTSQITHASV